MTDLGQCGICGKSIPGDEGVVLLLSEDEPTYWPFYEDLRASGWLAAYHPLCWGEKHGVRALVEIVHRRHVIDSGRTGEPAFPPRRKKVG